MIQAVKLFLKRLVRARIVIYSSKITTSNSKTNEIINFQNQNFWTFRPTQDDNVLQIFSKIFYCVLLEYKQEILLISELFKKTICPFSHNDAAHHTNQPVTDPFLRCHHSLPCYHSPFPIAPASLPFALHRHSSSTPQPQCCPPTVSIKHITRD